MKHKAAGFLAPDSFMTLKPTYIAQPPARDGWSNFMRYNLDAAGVNDNVRSLGRNGSANAIACGTTTNFNQDILFSDGVFLQWPEGTQD